MAKIEKCFNCKSTNLTEFYVEGQLFRVCEDCWRFMAVGMQNGLIEADDFHSMFMSKYPYCQLIDIQYDDIHGGGIPELAVLKKGQSPMPLAIKACVKVIDLWLVHQDLSKQQFPVWILKLLDNGWQQDYPMLAKLAETGK